MFLVRLKGALIFEVLVDYPDQGIVARRHGERYAPRLCPGAFNVLRQMLGHDSCLVLVFADKLPGEMNVAHPSTVGVVMPDSRSLSGRLRSLQGRFELGNGGASMSGEVTF